MKFRLEPKELGKLLSQLRQKAGMSQAKISKACSVNSPQYLSNIERGQCLPSLKILKTMLVEYKASQSDIDHLIELFIKSATTEIEDIFNTKLKIEYKVVAESTSSSYVDSPRVNLSLLANH